MEQINPRQCPPLVLAYLGDSVYEVYVRERLLREHQDMPVHKLHILATKRVKAHAQSNSIAALEDTFTEDELAIYKRGRNAKSATSPKNADISEYRRATGFEAVIGYLYLKNDTERLRAVMQSAYDSADNENERND